MTAGEFDGLVAAVTGGASGIGAAVAQRLNGLGATVAVLDRDDTAEPGITAIRCDVGDDTSVRAAIKQVVRRWGGLDIVVNNAGVGAQGTVTDNDDSEWLRVYDVNVLGIVRVSRAALPHLRQSKHPAIVNISSIAGTAGLPRRALYSATKGAVLALTRAMAADHVREGIRVNCVSPGTVDTPWIQRLIESAADPESELSALAARHPLGRLVTAAEVAAAVAYLAGPSAASTTGSIVEVDGGISGLRMPTKLAGAS